MTFPSIEKFTNWWRFGVQNHNLFEQGLPPQLDNLYKGDTLGEDPGFGGADSPRSRAARLSAYNPLDPFGDAKS